VLEKVAWAAGFHVTRKVNTLRSKRMAVIRRCGLKLLLDVGANVGQWAAEVLGDGFVGTVVSFEPHPEAYAELAKNAAENHICLNIGLGSQDGQAELFVTKGSVNSSFLKPVGRSNSSERVLSRSGQAAGSNPHVGRGDTRA